MKTGHTPTKHPLSAHLDQLETAEPVMPLEDRAADTWEPLIAIADLAAGNWPHRARTAAVLSSPPSGTRPPPPPTASDYSPTAEPRSATTTPSRPRSFSTGSRPTPEAPWTDYATTGLTTMKLGALLREYDIRSANIRFGLPTGQAKGYQRADFLDAWNRYCPTADEPAG
jgi:hypothetical protein